MLVWKVGDSCISAAQDKGGLNTMKHTPWPHMHTHTYVRTLTRTHTHKQIGMCILNINTMQVPILVLYINLQQTTIQMGIHNTYIYRWVIFYFYFFVVFFVVGNCIYSKCCAINAHNIVPIIGLNIH